MTESIIFFLTHKMSYYVYIGIKITHKCCFIAEIC